MTSDELPTADGTDLKPYTDGMTDGEKKVLSFF